MPPAAPTAPSILHHLRPGPLLYRFWHAPVSALRESLRQGGPLVQHRVRQGMKAMESSVSTLVPLCFDQAAAPLSPHLLTGARFWYQSAYCLQSLSFHSRRPLAPVIHDDGSLQPHQVAELRRLFPSLTLVTGGEARARLDQLLPESRFPTLRERWRAYPHIRKLLDVHLGSQGWKLVLDSDLLFFRAPSLLVAWCDAPDRPLVATDCMESYGYTRPLMARLCGHEPGARVNVGLCGLRSEDIDWERLEHWTTTLIREESTHYYLEQALTAMLVAGRPVLQAPDSDYRTFPTREEALAPTAAMHHYVDLSKRWYFSSCWRDCMGAQAPRARA